MKRLHTCWLTTTLMLLLGYPGQADISLVPGRQLKAKIQAPGKAEPFALSDVRLLDGPFREAMNRDAKYLLSLDADRLLHTFRANAGLPSDAKPLGGWESPKVELRGHFIGHYLSGCALIYASTGDEKLKERAALMVREMAKCQESLGSSGYLSAFPESFIDRVETTGKVWAPYYTLHKIHAGLLDVHVLCGNGQALEVAKKFGDWVKARNDKLTDEQLEKMLGVEHGGINESMANLYALTGEEKYLQCAKRLFHKRVMDPLVRREDKLAGLHANTQFPKVIGAARLYELTGEERYHTSAEFFWDRVVNHHSYVIGGNSDHEHFGQPDKLGDRVSPFSAETCNTYNMLKLTRHVFAWEPSVARADFYERGLYNQILASQDPRTGMMAYHVPIYGGWFMPYNTPEDSFWCCTGTGVENHAKYGDSIYWRDADGLYVNLFIPSELTWREKDIRVRQETKYPQEETTRLELTCAQPTTFALRIRQPGWVASAVQVRINGEDYPHSTKGGNFVKVQRTWKTGDRVEVRVPMALRIEAMPDKPSRVAFCYGPVVLAGSLGVDGMEPPRPYAKSQGDFFNTKPSALPVFVASAEKLGAWFERIPGKTLQFRTKGVGRPVDITFAPFYILASERYSIYWDLMSPEEWQKRQAAGEAKARREAELKNRTLDKVQIGDEQSERAHGLKGDRSRSGMFQEQVWRDADAGGSFSYELKIPASSAALLCTYWGGDGGNRTFDVLVEGTKIGTQKLSNNKPGEFFDVTYPIPAEVAQGKSKITVTFQGQPGQMAGGLFGLRLMRDGNN